MAARSDRIAVLQKQIKWIEEHYNDLYALRRHRSSSTIGNHINNKDNDINVKHLKQELLEEDLKYDKLRSLPVFV